MAKDETKTLIWAKNRGMNQWDPPSQVGREGSVETVNLHLYEGGLGTRRGGLTAVTTTGATDPLKALIEYIPGQDPTASELFVVDSSATTKILRCAGGSSFSNLTLVDNVASTPLEVNGVTLNGKLYLAYDSTVNRLHVFDPGLSTTKIRRAGMGTPAAATVANTGAGAYAATLRYYRVAFTEQRGGVTVRRSLLGSSVSFTPSGAGTAARVTKPASLSEDETHWELYASSDNVTFYLIATTVVGTTTYDDSATVSTYANGQAMPTEGANTPFPSVKYLATDGTRLLGFAVWESTAGDSLTPKAGRLFFGPVLDSSLTPYTVDDDERINNTTTLSGWIDVARNAGGADRGISRQPVNGIFYAFQSVGIYAIIPTESPIQPYRREVVSAVVGAVNHKSIVTATDKYGRPCCFFLDPTKGPMVVGGADGLRWCGKDVVTTWTSTLTQTQKQAAWAEWYPDRHQVWFGFGGTGYILVLDVTELYLDESGDLRGGWTFYSVADQNVVAAVTFASTLASPRPLDRLPYVAGGAGLARYDETATADWGTPINGYTISGSLSYGKQSMQVLRSYLYADPTGGIGNITITQRLIRNNNEDASPPTATTTINGSGLNSGQRILFRKFEATAQTEAWSIQVRLDDTDTVTRGPFTLWEWRGVITEGSDL